MDADYLCEKAELGSCLDAGQAKIIDAVLLHRALLVSGSNWTRMS